MSAIARQLACFLLDDDNGLNGWEERVQISTSGELCLEDGVAGRRKGRKVCVWDRNGFTNAMTNECCLGWKLNEVAKEKKPN